MTVPNDDMERLKQADNILQRIERIEQRLNASERASIEPTNLSELSPDLGDVRAGRFLATESDGDPTDPEFTGVFMTADPETFDGDDYNFGGVNLGTLQFGASITDGKLYSGQGAIVFDINGSSVLMIDSAEDIRAYKFIDSSGNVEGGLYGYTSSTMSSIELYAHLQDLSKKATINIESLSAINTDALLLLRARSGSSEDTVEIYFLDDADGQSFIAVNSNRADADLMVYGTQTDPLLFVDASNDRVGINTTTPRGRLHVSGGLIVSGTPSGYAAMVGLSGSTYGISGGGHGTVEMNGATSRDSTGWWKIKNGTTDVYVPFWTTITG